MAVRLPGMTMRRRPRPIFGMRAGKLLAHVSLGRDRMPSLAVGAYEAAEAELA